MIKDNRRNRIDLFYQVEDKVIGYICVVKILIKKSDNLPSAEYVCNLTITVRKLYQNDLSRYE